jgi:hypothetical protein
MIAAWLFTNFARDRSLCLEGASRDTPVRRPSGIGLIVGIPMLLFAGVIALPLAFIVQHFFHPTAGCHFLSISE